MGRRRFKAYHYGVRDYLRDNYGAKDLKIHYGGKHPHLHFNVQVNGDWQHHSVVLSLTHDPVAAINIKAQEIRRLLGPHHPKEPPQRRHLDDMTAELQSSTAMVTVFTPNPSLTLETNEYLTDAISLPTEKPMITKVINPKSPKTPPAMKIPAMKIPAMKIPAMKIKEVEPERYASRVAIYDRCLHLLLPPKLVEGWQQKAEFSCSVQLTSPGHWKIARAPLVTAKVIGPKFIREGKLMLLKCNATDSWLQHGSFGITAATAWLADDAILVKLEGETRPVASRLPPVTPEALLPKEPEMSIQPDPPPIFTKPQPATLASPTLIQVMRHALEVLNQIERDTPYRLHRNDRTDRWEFRAPAITLDDDLDYTGPV